MEPLTWTTVRRKVDDLIPYEKNPRTLSKEQESSLKKSLLQFNLVEIPAIDTNNKIIAGHQRLKVMQLLGRGSEEIDVRIPNRSLTKDEYEKYLLTSNAVTGSWDYDLLKDFDPNLLTDIGFDENILSDIWDKNIETGIEEFDEKKELEKITEPKTRLGDLIVLGNHRVICGDSNDSQVIEKLFGEEKTSMIYSDPIYNISLDYNKGLGGKQNYGANVEDNRSEDEYVEFLRNNISSALSVANPNCHVFYWNTEQHIWILQTLYKEFGIKNKRVCLWVKNGSNPTPQVAFGKCYEPCTYGTLGSPYLSPKQQGLTEVLNHDIRSGNDSLDDINLWTCRRLSSKDYQHATSKPPELHHKAILRCTKPNDIVLDTFGGSGSTLIGCEQLKRRAYLVELEPVFCDLIIARFEKMTGIKAKAIHHEEEQEEKIS